MQLHTTYHFFCVLILATAVCASQSRVTFSQTDSPRLELSIGGQKLEAEVAATPDARDQGLMGRNRLADNHGMLFVFPEEHAYCMWMQNTHIPLSVAFINAKGVIINIVDMKPDSQDFHCASKPIRYGLEMNAGWFDRKKITPGKYVNGIEKAPAGQ
ncbi:MAG: DUF192 domain-containing protein [Desulfuromonadales bacterium]|nr:DUF192 domain-containing protein [Desulfuromonadales bacterium]